MRKLFFIIACLIFAANISYAADFSAKAVVERDEVYEGEPFTFQIQVSGSENPEQPDMSHLNDFTVNFLGGRQNSSSSITIINGKVSQDVRKGYFFTWQLTPKKTGRLIIPSIEVSADGQRVSTDPIVVRVSKPVETEDFKLRLNLSRKECYVGEPLLLNVKWYIGKNVQDFSFNLPLVETDDFLFTDMKVDAGSGKKLYRINLGNREAIAEEGRESYEGREYVTLSFSLGITPKRSGRIAIENATVACSALEGYERRRSTDPFSGFFDDDFFGMSRRGVYKKVVIPSNSPVINVKELPTEGRPNDFTGYVGEFELKTSAEPLEVNVGDPVTLTISISGPEFLEHVNAPDLNRQKTLAENFRIPSEMASGSVSGNEKVFTQTIRPMNPNVTEIPSIEIPYFDTSLKKYQYASSKPIPIKVNETNVITFLDAEGAPVHGPSGAEIETLDRGIAFNYEDMSLIESERLYPLSWLKSTGIALIIFLPPFLYLLLFSGTLLHRKRNADPLKNRAKKSYRALVDSLKKARKSGSGVDETSEVVLNAFREYLGAKLRLSSGAITFRDIREHLVKRDIDKGIIERLRNIFECCEAGRYTGNNLVSDRDSIIEQGLALAQELEKVLK